MMATLKELQFRGDRRSEWEIGHISVLLIDDSPSDLMILGALLDVAGGYAHSAVQSGTEALAYLEDSTPDICLVDFDMPGMTGIDFVTRARELRPDLPCLIVTGTPASHLETSARVAGVDAVLSKADLTPGYINLAINDTIAKHSTESSPDDGASSDHRFPDRDAM